MSENQLLKLNRRRFLYLGSCGVVANFLTSPRVAWTKENAERSLTFYNTQNGEWYRGIYWEKGAYIPGALTDINHVLRDSRNGKIAHIDVGLLDVLNTMRHRLKTTKPYDVICGYRSVETNELLRKQSTGVAKNSLHMKGRAIDIRLSGTPLTQLRDAAKSLNAGGVGYYPRSNFIHVDVRDTPYYW